MGNDESAEHTEPLPDIRPWLEVGWMFRDGDAQVIERRSNRTRARPVPGHDE